MRPYSIHKEDSKYIQPVISNATGIHPSPLALLAATCSRIGDTFHEDTTIFTQKNISLEKGRSDVTTLKSCVDTRPNILACTDRIPDIQQNISPLYPPAASQITSSCFKIKHEDTFDYNQNCEGLHICPNVIAEARMLETQARVSFSKSCSRDSIQSTCDHNQEQSNNNTFNFNAPSCEQAMMPGQTSVPESSCIYQNSPLSVSSQSSSCALDNVSLSASALSHVPPINQNLHFNNMDSYPLRPKPYQPTWQNQQEFQRNNSLSNEDKSSCLLHESFQNTASNSSTQEYTSNDPRSRQFRNSLSHMDTTEQQPYQRPQHHGSVSSQPPEQYFHPSSVNPNNTHNSYHYSNYNMDVKPDPYNIPQHSLRQPTACMSPNYPPPPQTHMMQQPPQLPPPHMNMNHPVHNHPAGMPSSFCTICNPQANNAYMHEMVGGASMPGPDLQAQSLAEYQYQQQQMLFARDNRRPRRIACTCPNCRDGENKTVTTKDGKQRKLHVCHIPGCGKIYGKTSHLRAHLRWHAGERPFACNWLFCNKRFTRSDELQRHRRTHTGDKRFECSVCLKKFMRSDHLSKHMKTHQAQKLNKEKTETSSDSNEKSSSNDTSKVKEEERP